MGSCLMKLFGSNSEVSMMRVMSFGIVSNIMIVWTVACWKEGAIVAIGWDNASLLMTAMLGKAVQRFAEVPKE